MAEKKSVNKKNINKKPIKKTTQKQMDVEAIFNTSPSDEIKDKHTKKEQKKLLEEIEKTVKINVDRIVLEQAKINDQGKEFNDVVKEKYKGIIYVTLGFLAICLLLMIYTINNTNVQVKSLEETIEKRITKIINVSPTTLFYGDSITNQYNLNKYFNNANYINKGVDGATSSDALETLEKSVLEYHPKEVFLLIGINDINKDIKDNETISNIEQMIIKIKNNNKQTKIYITSILPINDSDNDKIKPKVVGDRTNKQVKNLNRQIKSMCNKHDVTYIDAYSKMIDSDNLLNIDYTKEGLHLNDNGYKKLTSIINEYLKTDN